MKISVITVCYNSASTIEQTIISVLDQDHSDVEYIIIDGASTDATASIVEPYRRKLKLFISEPDKGLYHAFNKGLALATGDVVAILNSDDFYADKNTLSKVAACFEQNNAEAVYGDLVYVDKENTEQVVRKWHSGVYKKGDFLNGWMPPHPAFFVKRDVYERFGVFNTTLRYAADYELMLRFIHKHAIRIAYIPSVVVKMRTGGFGNSSLMAKYKANREDRQAWTINGLRPYPWTLLFKPLSKIFQYIK